MGKKNKASQIGPAKPAPGANQATKASEIDDIFGNKAPKATSAGQSIATTGKSERVAATGAAEAVSGAAESKKAKKKRKRAETDATASETLGDRIKSKEDGKKVAPVTVVDSSAQLLSVASKKRSKHAATASAPTEDDDDAFRDSRGTSNRKWKCFVVVSY